MSYNCMPIHCAHIDETLEDVRSLENPKACSGCKAPGSGVNFWICLRKDCNPRYVGCSEQVKDHSTLHYKENREHCVHMNMTTRRAWCYECEKEVFLPQSQQQELSRRVLEVIDPIVSDSVSASSSSNTNTALRFMPSSGNSNSSSKSGLVGLQNIANTCYMNSALQALSNLEPMTYYFLNYGVLIEHALEQSTASQRCKAGLAKSYQTLMHDIWDNVENRDHIAPRSLLYGVRSVQPQFRGFQHHDTQEFLRCFMDHLHEELKETTQNIPASANSPNANCQQPNLPPIGLQARGSDDTGIGMERESSPSPSPMHSRSSSVSGTEYETADSSISSVDDNNMHQYDCNQGVLRDCGSSGTGTNVTSNMSPKSDRYAGANTTTEKNESEEQQASSSHSIISDVFDGKLLSSVQCLTCNRISTREETFQDLSLPIPNRESLNELHKTYSMSTTSLNKIMDIGAVKANNGWLSWFWNWFRSYIYGPTVSLYDCMASFFSADELKGDNMYSCEKCKKLRTGVKYSKILDLPEVLCIHLKRFRHDSSYSSKISSPVQFPLEGLDMRQYLHADCTSKVSTYNLSSVICHHGSVGSGHYICFARNHLTNRWYEYDDHRVSEVSAEVVENCQAYVLFYRKHNPEMELIRAEAHEISLTNPIDPGINMLFYVSSEWLMRFYTFAEPGPINNWAILCPHGGILHSKRKIAAKIAEPISQATWDYLYEEFGGGPAINVLFGCELCRRAAEQLDQRRLFELGAFTRYNTIEADIESSAIFAISMAWLRKWQQFVRGITNNEPGPITNESISATKSRADGKKSTSPILTSALIHNVRAGSDYAQLNALQWRLLHQIYGGGPEILLRGCVNDENTLSDDEQHNEISSCSNCIDHGVQVKHFPHETEPIHNHKRNITKSIDPNVYKNNDDYSDTESNIDENLMNKFSPNNTDKSNIHNYYYKTKVAYNNPDHNYNNNNNNNNNGGSDQHIKENHELTLNPNDCSDDSNVNDFTETYKETDGQQTSIKTKAREYFHKDGFKLPRPGGAVLLSATAAATSIASYHMGSGKMKPKSNVFRKRNKRVRHALKHGDLFGPKGHYSVSSSTYGNEMAGNNESYQTDNSNSMEKDYNGNSDTVIATPSEMSFVNMNTDAFLETTKSQKATSTTKATTKMNRKINLTFPSEKIHKKHVRKHLSRLTESRAGVAEITSAYSEGGVSDCAENTGSGSESFFGANGTNSDTVSSSSKSHRKSAGSKVSKSLKHENSVTLKKFVQLRGDASEETDI